MIVKIQISQFSTQGESILIYDETREYRYESNNLEEVKTIKPLLKGRPKAYFDAELDENNAFQIKDEVSTQDW